MKSITFSLCASAIALVFSTGAFAGTDSGGGGGGCADGTLCDTSPAPTNSGGTDSASEVSPPDVTGTVSAGDADLDGVKDNEDNCVLTANADQRDSNGDGFGNACDADLDNNGIVSCSDLTILEDYFHAVGNLDADLNGDFVVNASDLGLMRAAFFSAPGPSGIATRTN